VLGKALGQLNYLLFGGESLDPGAARLVLKHNPPRHLLHVYGPTETTTFATAFHIEHVEDDATSIPIGHAIAETQIYVLDAAMQPVPVGVTGQIYIGGAGVALGYLQRPELTAERFVPNTFATETPSHLYKTGDMGCWRSPGVLAYVGRDDQQVKIRGFRIEPGEIESQLARLDAVREAVVMAREDQPGNKRLVAYLTLQDSAEASATTAEGLRDKLRAVLPDYMVPSAFVILDELPLTPNGKLDRRALPAPLDVLGLKASGDELPQGATENALADIWKALLHLPVIRRHDHFFDNGGHSLLAVQLVARVQEQMGLNLALRQVFDSPTLISMARELDAMSADGEVIAPIPPAAREASLPLSWAQQRLWFLDQLDGASAAYVIPVALRLQGELDVPALRASLSAMVQRHQTLRTVFTSSEGHAAQRILDVASFDVELLEASAGESADQLAQEAQSAVMNTPFDLRTGPLIRARLVRVSGNGHLLFLAMHHIISDGWSMGVLVQEVVALYGALTSTRQPGKASAQIPHKAVQAALSTLPPLPIQYADYAVWQRRVLSGATLASQATFWRETLHGSPSLITLPADHARPAVQTYAGNRVPVALGSALTHELKACAQRHGVTLHMLLLTSWSLLMARLSAQDDVVIGTPVSNRNRRELEGLIGFFVNTLPLRIRPRASMDVAALLREVKQHTLAAYAHQDLPFDQIVEAVQPPRSLSHSPVFQVLFSLNNTPASEATLPGLKASTVTLPATSTQFDLALGLQEAEANIVGSLDFASDLFEQATMQRWITLWRTLLQGFCEAQPDTLVSALPWLDGAERKLVVDTFNATSQPYPEHSVIHELFEAQARQYPNAIALEFKSTQLT
jgi:hypothetical protein